MKGLWRGLCYGLSRRGPGGSFWRPRPVRGPQVSIDRSRLWRRVL